MKTTKSIMDSTSATKYVLRDGELVSVWVDADTKMGWLLLGSYSLTYDKNLDGPLYDRTYVMEHFPEYLV